MSNKATDASILLNTDFEEESCFFTDEESFKDLEAQ